MARSPTADGNGYIAQAKELELAKRDNARLLTEIAAASREINALRSEVIQEQAVSRELSAATTHHVRTAFGLGAGAGVILCLILWGLSTLVLH